MPEGCSSPMALSLMLTLLPLVSSTSIWLARKKEEA